jgi:hypothetical protein
MTLVDTSVLPDIAPDDTRWFFDAGYIDGSSRDSRLLPFRVRFVDGSERPSETETARY